MKFLVDNHLPATLARFLSSLGEDCRHVLECGLAQASDREIWSFAAAENLVLISKDEDFLHLAKRTGAAVQLVWVRLGNCRNAALIEAFGNAWPRVLKSMESGERVIELR